MLIIVPIYKKAIETLPKSFLKNLEKLWKKQKKMETIQKTTALLEIKIVD